MRTTVMDTSACCIPLARIQEGNSQARARGLPDASQEGRTRSRELLCSVLGPLHDTSKSC